MSTITRKECETFLGRLTGLALLHKRKMEELKDDANELNRLEKEYLNERYELIGAYNPSYKAENNITLVRKKIMYLGACWDEAALLLGGDSDEAKEARKKFFEHIGAVPIERIGTRYSNPVVRLMAEEWSRAISEFRTRTSSWDGWQNYDTKGSYTESDYETFASTAELSKDWESVSLLRELHPELNQYLQESEISRLCVNRMKPKFKRWGLDPELLTYWNV